MNNLSKFSEAVKKIPYKKTILGIGAVAALSIMAEASIQELRSAQSVYITNMKKHEELLKKSGVVLDQKILDQAMYVRSHLDVFDAAEVIGFDIDNDDVVRKGFSINLVFSIQSIVFYQKYFDEIQEFHPEFERVKTLNEEYRSFEDMYHLFEFGKNTNTMSREEIRDLYFKLDKVLEKYIQEYKLSEVSVHLGKQKAREGRYMKSLSHKALLNRQSEELYEVLYNLLWNQKSSLSVSQNKPKLKVLQRD